MKKKLAGWDYRGQPFSKEQFDRSYLKSKGGIKTYRSYLMSLVRFQKKSKKSSETTKQKRRRSVSGFI